MSYDDDTFKNGNTSISNQLGVRSDMIAHLSEVVTTSATFQTAFWDGLDNSSLCHMQELFLFNSTYNTTASAALVRLGVRNSAFNETNYKVT